MDYVYLEGGNEENENGHEEKNAEKEEEEEEEKHKKEEKKTKGKGTKRKRKQSEEDGVGGKAQEGTELKTRWLTEEELQGAAVSKGMRKCFDLVGQWRNKTEKQQQGSRASAKVQSRQKQSSLDAFVKKK